MALSGTLDTFELPDVLRLLASTAKSGRLRITGDRGSGSIWVHEGQVVTTEYAGSFGGDVSDDEAVFAMLRFAAGSFTFDADATAPGNADPQPLEPVLSSAEAMLAEWRLIEEVVPSLDEWTVLAYELEGPDVMVDAERWRSIAIIGSGASVGTLAEKLALNEMNACRLVKELIELGLVELTDRPVDAPPLVAGAPAPDSVEDVISEVEAQADDVIEVVDEPEVFAPSPELADLATTDAFDVAADEAEVTLSDDADLAVAELADDGPESNGAAALADPGSSEGDQLEPFGDQLVAETDMFSASSEAEIDGTDLDPAEMARQLANLSPKAAKAVAAAARASTDAERDAALAAVEAEDDSVNRGLLLKFLGSVDS